MFTLISDENRKAAKMLEMVMFELIDKIWIAPTDIDALYIDSI